MSPKEFLFRIRDLSPPTIGLYVANVVYYMLIRRILFLPYQEVETERAETELAPAPEIRCVRQSWFLHSCLYGHKLHVNAILSGAAECDDEERLDVNQVIFVADY